MFLHPRPGTDLVWLSAVTRYILDNGLAKTEFLAAVGQRARGVSQEPGAVHDGVCASETCGLPVETLKRVARDDRRGEERVRSVGDGRHAAQPGLRHVDRDFESAAGHRQLHAAGHGRVSVARAQQRAGRERPRRDAESFCRAINRSTIPKCARSFEAGVGREAAADQGPRQSRDGRRDSRGQAEGDVSDRRGNEPGRLERELCGRGASRSWTSSWCRTFSSAQPAGLPTWFCRRSPSLEKEGTFTSTERRIQRLYQVFEPLGESRPDWQIIQDVANRLGAGWNYAHPSEIYG